jgi:hypothetical protein
MVNETELAYAEVDAILELLEDEYVNRIPAQVREFFKKEKNKEYILNIRSDIGLDGQKIKAETISLLTLLQINYLCDSEEERKEILKELQENDRLKEEESREKYNPDNIFKNRNNKLEKEENVAMVEYKEPSFIRRILDRIKILFKR